MESLKEMKENSTSTSRFDFDFALRLHGSTSRLQLLSFDGVVNPTLDRDSFTGEWYRGRRVALYKL